MFVCYRMALITVTILFLLLPLVCSNIIVRENVVFEKVNEISTTRSQWLVAIQLDFDPYGKLIRHIGREIVLAQKHIFGAEKDPNTGGMKNVTKSTLHLLRTMTFEFLNFKHAQEYLAAEFTDIRGMGRSKRSLIPIIGKGLSYMFGVLTEADIESLRINIKRLAKEQQNIKHVVNESLTILKNIQGQVRDNRRSINNIIDDITDITDRLRKSIKGLSHVQDYLELYAMLDRANAEIRELLNIARDHLQVMRLQLSMLSLGHVSSTIISPSQLKSLLIDIKERLSPQFTLPFDPEHDIWTFYKTITCTTLIDKHHIIVVIAVPLIDNTGMYEVYKIHNIPVPYRFNQTTIRAKYKLETTHIAVDLKRTKFAALSVPEAASCSDTLRPYCTFSSPAYSVISTKMCVMQLFGGDRDRIKEYCQEIVLPNAPSPQAEYLRNGHWLITSEKPLTLSLLCNMTQSTIVTKPPMDIVALNATCSAHDAHFSLLPYYHEESKYNMTSTFTTLLQKYSTKVVHVWEKFDRQMPNTSLIIPPKLKDVDEVPLDRLIDELNDYNLSLEPMDMDYDRYILYGLVTFLFILLLVAFCFRTKLLNCLKRYSMFSKLINYKWSGGGGEGEISQQSPPVWVRSEMPTPSAPTRDAAPGLVRSAKSTPSAPTGDASVQIDGQKVYFRPDRDLSLRYLQEKYVRPASVNVMPTNSTNINLSTEVAANISAVLTQDRHEQNVQVDKSSSLPRLSSVYPEICPV
jgi:hypothetical protein